MQIALLYGALQYYHINEKWPQVISTTCLVPICSIFFHISVSELYLMFYKGIILLKFYIDVDLKQKLKYLSLNISLSGRTHLAYLVVNSLNMVKPRISTQKCKHCSNLQHIDSDAAYVTHLCSPGILFSEKPLQSVPPLLLQIFVKFYRFSWYFTAFYRILWEFAEIL